MKQPVCKWLVLLAGVCSLGACGSHGGGNNGGTTPAPQPPVVQSPQSPDFDVSGPWSGTDSDSQGSGALSFSLTQDGGVVLGSGTITEDKQRGGFFAGTLSGSTLYFNFNYGVNCVRMVSGTLMVGPDSMTGTFSGTDSCGNKVQTGQVSLTSVRLNLAGTWTGTAPSVLGSGTWTWQLQQTNNKITGTAFIQTNNLQESDALQGVFWYPSLDPTFSMSLMLSSSPCAGVNVALTPLRDAVPLTATQINGLATLATPCFPGSFANFTLNKR